MANDYLDGQQSLLDGLAGMFLPAGTPFEIRVAAASLMTDAQQAYFKLRTQAAVAIDSLSQRVTKIGNPPRDLGRDGPPELGDAEIAISGVPSAGGSAAETVAMLLKSLAAVGVAGALVSFVTKSDNVPEDAAKTAKAVGVPIILILLLLLLILHEWNKVEI